MYIYFDRSQRTQEETIRLQATSLLLINAKNSAFHLNEVICFKSKLFGYIV